MPPTPGSRPEDTPSRPEGDRAAALLGPVLDLRHLARQCMGDRALEAEVLQQFRAQAEILIESLTRDDGLSAAAKADIAHRLKGSALAIGAFPVARAAAAVEALGRAGAERGHESSGQAVDLSQAVADLSEAVSQAVAEVEQRLGFSL